VRRPFDSAPQVRQSATHRRQKPRHDALESQRGPDGLTSKRISELRCRAIRTATFEPSARFHRRRPPGDAPSAKGRMNQRRACRDLMEDRGDFRGLGDQAGAAKRSYSARAALRFSALTSKARQLKSPTALRTRQGQSDPSWGAFSEADDENDSRASLHLPYAPAWPGHHFHVAVSAWLAGHSWIGFDIHDRSPRSRNRAAHSRP
jgi:hypothetical protein